MNQDEADEVYADLDEARELLAQFADYLTIPGRGERLKLNSQIGEFLDRMDENYGSLRR